MHIASLVKSPCYLLVIILKRKCGRVSGRYQICPLAIPNQISTISMHIPSLVKIHWCLLKSSGNEKRTDGHTTDGRTDLRTDKHTDVQRDTIIPHNYCVAGYKNGSTMCIYWNKDSKRKSRWERWTHMHKWNKKLKCLNCLGQTSLFRPIRPNQWLKKLIILPTQTHTKNPRLILRNPSHGLNYCLVNIAAELRPSLVAT